MTNDLYCRHCDRSFSNDENRCGSCPAGWDKPITQPTSQQLIDDLKKYKYMLQEMMMGQKEKIKMTREEANDKLFQVSKQHGMMTTLVDQLEALGLIKFEEKSVPTAKEIISQQGYNADRLTKQLEEHGYKIVRQP